MYLAWLCLSDANSSVAGWFQTPHWAPVAMVRSHYRGGWEPRTAIIGACLWQNPCIEEASFVCRTSVWSVGGRFQTPHWAPVAMVRSHHRRGWRPCTAIIGDGLWQKSMCLALVCSSDVDSSVGSRFQTPHWAPVAMARSHHRRSWKPCTYVIGNGLGQKSMYFAWLCCPTPIQALGVDLKRNTGPQWPWYEATIVEAVDLVQLL